MKFTSYDPGEFFDEMFEAEGRPRPGTELLVQKIESLSGGELRQRQQAAEQAFLDMGITFNVYGNEAGVERIWPFDIIPRIVEAGDWRFIERGLDQRIRALNLFIDDVYHEQKIVRDGVIPDYVIRSAKGFLKPCVGLHPPRGIWCHIAGIDLIRDGDGQFCVLEDNLRCPSGVSYVLENRRILKRMFPQVFDALRVRPVDDYPGRLLETLRYLAPDDLSAPTVVLLTPGIYNSAYFEHSFLAQQMGVELVEGRDLVIVDGFVCMRTTIGFQRVDVEPRPAGISECIDLDGNSTVRLWFDGLHESLTITAASEAETLRTNPFDYFLEPDAVKLPMTCSGMHAALLEPYRIPCSSDKEVADFAGTIAREVAGQTIPFLNALNGRIYDTCEKTIREGGDPLPPAVTLARRKGACRDLTVLFMEACRSIGIAARFVSGYQAGDPEERERYLHAWAEVYLPGAGWRGYDPMHGLAVADQHVVLATGPTPDQARPISGTFRGTGITSDMHAAISIKHFAR